MFPDIGALLSGMFSGGAPGMPTGMMPQQVDRMLQNPPIPGTPGAGGAMAGYENMAPPMGQPAVPFAVPSPQALGMPPTALDTGPTDIGAALAGSVPMPRPRPMPGDIQGPATGPGAPMDISTPGAQANPTGMPEKSMSDKLMETLKGVKMPAGPELQRLGTPAAPRPTTQIKGGDLMALLAAAGGGQGSQGIDYKLPSTLGMALNGRR